MRKRKQKRQVEKTNKKYFWPRTLITIFAWFGVTIMFFTLPPEEPWIIACFLALLFVALLFTFTLAFDNTRRGLLVSGATLTFLVMRLFDIGNVLNLLLLIGVFAAVEWYASTK